MNRGGRTEEPGSADVRVLKPTHLVIICCHGVWLGGPTQGQDDAEWLIAPYQKGEPPTFFEHLKRGLRFFQEYKGDGSGGPVLIISGGPTHPRTQCSEAQSYLNLASTHSFWESSPGSFTSSQRILVEDRALDSFHNLLFSITLFESTYGRYPQHITIISYEFKRARFMDLHIPAIHWPVDKVDFIGIDPQHMSSDVARADSVRKGERMNGFQPWEMDMLGTGELLTEKRRRRNPWNVDQNVQRNGGTSESDFACNRWPWETSFGKES